MGHPQSTMFPYKFAKVSDHRVLCTSLFITSMSRLLTTLQRAITVKRFLLPAQRLPNSSTSRQRTRTSLRTVSQHRILR